MSVPQWNRKLHRLGALLVAGPLLVIAVSGVFLQLKKHWGWVQPPTRSGATPHELSLTWEEILHAVRAEPEARAASWRDVERIDVQPGKGMLKVQLVNRWEVQLDATTGAVLSSAYRRSDLIESIHDGTWFHEPAKLWIWLPTAFLLCGLWGTGVYLWLLPYRIKRRRKRSSTTTKVARRA